MKAISTERLAWPDGKLYWSGPIDLKKSGFLVGGRLLLANAFNSPMTTMSSTKATNFGIVRNKYIFFLKDPV
jgi:hypothetical protein